MKHTKINEEENTDKGCGKQEMIKKTTKIRFA